MIKTDTFIISNEKRRGHGKDRTSPIRIVTSVLTLDGKPVAEDDPCSLTIEEVVGLFPADELTTVPRQWLIEKMLHYMDNKKPPTQL